MRESSFFFLVVVVDRIACRACCRLIDEFLQIVNTEAARVD